MTEQKDEAPAVRIVLWALVFAVALVWRGPSLVASFGAPDTILNDFFQDWAAARYYLDGKAPYADQEFAVNHYLGRTVPRGKHSVFNVYNAHPPTSILLFFPLASLPYPDASRLWSAFWLCTLPLSFVLICRALGLRLPWWSVFPVGTAWLLCNPLGEELAYGQFNLLLLLGATLAWLADRSDRPALAGALLGALTAIKLFPGFLFLPFLLRRRWAVLAAGAVAFAALTALTAIVLGPGAYVDYLQVVMPEVASQRDSWLNLSVPGYFTRLFASPRGKALPLVDSPALAAACIAAAVLLVLAVYARAAWGANPGKEADHAFALSLVAMLVVSPVTWPHYLLLLLPPVLLLWRDLPEGAGRALYLVCLVVFLIPPFALQSWATGATLADWNSRAALPWQSLTAFGVHTYALVAFFLLGLSAALHARAGAGAHEGPRP